MPCSQRAFREIVALKKESTRFFRILRFLFNEFTESLEVGRPCRTHELEGDAFAGLDVNAFRS